MKNKNNGEKMKVILKKGISTVANRSFELVPGIANDIPKEFFDKDIMVAVGKEEGSGENTEIKPLSFKEELIALPGIGKSIAKKILELASDKAKLSKVPRTKLLQLLKDDVVIVLDKYLDNTQIKEDN